MSAARHTVVPFERPAAYWATRARQHYTPANLPNAARLMRKAFEKSGDGGMALELAQIYGGMGCYTAAERSLMKAVCRCGLTGGACYLIGCCALNRDDEELGEMALEASLRLDPTGPYADKAQDMLEDYPWSEGEYHFRGERSRVLQCRAQKALLMNEREAALQWARAAWERGRRADTALLLGEMQADARAGTAWLHYAARHLPGRIEPRLALARSCAQRGQAANARRHLALAMILGKSIAQAEAFCQTAWEIGCADMALEMCRARLEQFPSSVDYLRLKYLSLLRLGEREKASRTLQSLMDIDPDDAAGLWYRRHPEETRLLSMHAGLLGALAMRVAQAAPPRPSGQLNRLLHLLVMALKDSVRPRDIYRLTPPLWRRLSPAQRRACDLRTSPAAMAFSIYLLFMTGNYGEAAKLYNVLPHKKRIGRMIGQFLRWTTKEE